MKKSFNPEYLAERFPNYEIKVNTKESKGSGMFGNIIPFRFRFKRVLNKVFRERNYVVKKFKEDKISMRDKSYDIWEILKKLEFNTFNLYKKFEEDKIIMNDLSLNNKFCISTYETNNNYLNEDIHFLKSYKIKRILNFKELVINGFDVVERLFYERIEFENEDIFFYVGEKKEETRIEIVIGDFDAMYLNSMTREPSIRLFYNSINNLLDIVVDSKDVEIFRYYKMFLRQEFERRREKL